jgi:transaldolase
MYVEDLIAPGVVNTMPESTLHAFADHGEVKPDTITPYYAEARQVIDDLASVGVDYDDVVDTLEREGVEKFSASWNDLEAGVRTSLDSGNE